jgi:uncharacterized protein YprB with RNaseH-like and TPR domain
VTLAVRVAPLDPMIRRTFQLISGIGPYRERDLWARGFEQWAQFPREGEEPAVSAKLDPQLREKLALAEEALEARDLHALAALIPPREHWRLYREFADEALFFDIEAEGARSMETTVVGVFDREGVHTFVRGRNLEELPERLAKSRVWVSFNGSVFDVPILKQHFGDALPVPAIHIDLRFVCRKFGMKGGLKQLEDTLGIGRPPHLKGVNGLDAVILWRAYHRTGDIEALRYLVEYNLYDAFQLRSVMDHAFNRATELLACDVPRIRPFDRGDILYDVTRLLMAISPTAKDTQRLAELRAQYG